MTVSPTTDDAEAIVLDYDLDESPEKLWRALTDPALVAQWLAPNDMAPDDSASTVGQRFALTPSPETPIECEVVDADPERKLSYHWREAGENGRPLDSIVTFEITALPAGRSHLRLVHRDAALPGAGGMRGVLTRAANDNRTGSLAWAA